MKDILFRHQRIYRVSVKKVHSHLRISKNHQ